MVGDLLESVSGRAEQYDKIVADWTRYRSELERTTADLQTRIDQRSQVSVSRTG